MITRATPILPVLLALLAGSLASSCCCPFGAKDPAPPADAAHEHAPQQAAPRAGVAEPFPQGWVMASTKPSGPTATWEEVSDPTSPDGSAIAMTAHANSATSTFNLCWNERLRFQHGALRVRVKANAGEDDQGGGPMWRVQDADNYYICRWNPLEKNFRLYSVVAGTRKQLAGATVELDPAQWHEILVEQAGPAIRCRIGDTVLEAQDSSLPGEGFVGLWTKADALTSFDDLVVEQVRLLGY